MIQSPALPRVILTGVFIAAAACAPAPRQRPVELGPVNQGDPVG